MAHVKFRAKDGKLYTMWGETRTSKILGKMGISAMPDYSEDFFKPHKACFDFPFPIQV